MLELHYAVPGVGGVLVPLNTRLADKEYDYILEHCGAKVLVADRELDTDLRVVSLDEYEELVEAADPIERPRAPRGRAHDDLDQLHLGHHRQAQGRDDQPPRRLPARAGRHRRGAPHAAQLYLWTLPMFHCNGWAYPWAVTAMGAKHVCLPKVEAKPIWNALTKEGITHLCAAPTVLTTIVGADEAEKLDEPAQVFVGGAPPSPALLGKGAKLNLDITHLYGLTETYGPLAVCAWNPDWDELDDEEQAEAARPPGRRHRRLRAPARGRRGHE